MTRVFLAVVLLVTMAVACTTLEPGSLAYLRHEQAVKVQKECHSYFFWREPRLLYPDSRYYCRQVYMSVMRGDPFINWRK